MERGGGEEERRRMREWEDMRWGLEERRRLDREKGR